MLECNTSIAPCTSCLLVEISVCMSLRHEIKGCVASSKNQWLNYFLYYIHYLDKNMVYTYICN